MVRLELEYWHLMDAPKQEKQESVLGYVLRACIILEKNHAQRIDDKQHKVTDEETFRRENDERLNGIIQNVSLFFYPLPILNYRVY